MVLLKSMFRCIYGQIFVVDIASLPLGNSDWKEGGGGGVTRHMTGSANNVSKSVRRVCFSDMRRRQQFSFLKGVHFHRTLGVPLTKT